VEGVADASLQEKRRASGSKSTATGSTSCVATNDAEVRSTDSLRSMFGIDVVFYDNYLLWLSSVLLGMMIN